MPTDRLPSAPAERGLLAQLMSVQGAICREVRDVRLAMRELVKHDPRDPWMVPMPLDGEPLEGPIKVAFTKNTFEFPLHPAVEQALDTAAAALGDAGRFGDEDMVRVKNVAEPLRYRHLLR